MLKHFLTPTFLRYLLVGGFGFIIDYGGMEILYHLGLEVHAGHGLDYASAELISALLEIFELNIGHFLIGEAIQVGLTEAVRAMRAAMDRGRAAAGAA